MDSLREIMDEALDAVLDPDIFGEPHDINGRTLWVDVDNDVLRERADAGGVAGMHLGRILFFARASDFPEVPEPGQSMFFDKKPMRVETCGVDCGMLEIVLSQQRKGR